MMGSGSSIEARPIAELNEEDKKREGVIRREEEIRKKITEELEEEIRKRIKEELEEEIRMAKQDDSVHKY